MIKFWPTTKKYKKKTLKSQQSGANEHLSMDFYCYFFFLLKKVDFSHYHKRESHFKKNWLDQTVRLR